MTKPTRPVRVDRWRDAAAKAGVDALLAMKLENVFHGSGFNAKITSRPPIIVSSPGQDPALLVNCLRVAPAKEISFLSDIRGYDTWPGFESFAPNWYTAVAKILTERRAASGKIGIEGTMTLDDQDLLKKALPNATFIRVNKTFRDLRMIKNPDEIANARIAGHFTTIGHAAAVTAIKAGKSEVGIVAAAMAAMNAEWEAKYPNLDVGAFGSLEAGEHHALHCWVTAGKRRDYVTTPPTDYVPQRGDLVSVNFWTTANGCRAEHEQVVYIGNVPNAAENARKTVFSARAAMFDTLRPGTILKDVYEAGWKRYLADGEKPNSAPARMGHFIGIGAHEDISITAQSEVVLQEGMILTIEPHIVIFDGLLSMYSSTIVITKNGYDYITNPIKDAIRV